MIADAQSTQVAVALVGLVVGALVVTLAVLAIVRLRRRRRWRRGLAAVAGVRPGEQLPDALVGFTEITAEPAPPASPTASPAIVPPSPPTPDWYPCPTGETETLRYWDGETWTHHVARPEAESAG